MPQTTKTISAIAIRDFNKPPPKPQYHPTHWARSFILPLLDKNSLKKHMVSPPESLFSWLSDFRSQSSIRFPVHRPKGIIQLIIEPLQL
jgi:hypothetical protein